MKKKYIILNILLIVIGCSNSNPGSQTKTQANVKKPVIVEKKTFSLTSDQYIKRYNESLSALEVPLRMRKKDESEAGENILIQTIVNKNLVMLLQEGKNNGFLNYVTFIGSGDGSLKSGLNLIMCLISTIMAVENPQMTREERGIILNDLGIGDGQFPKEGEELTFIRERVKYKLAKMKDMGTWLTAEPI